MSFLACLGLSQDVCSTQSKATVVVDPSVSDFSLIDVEKGGKTTSVYLSVVQIVYDKMKNEEKNMISRPSNAPLVTIMESSQELAEQTLEQIQRFHKNLNNSNIRELLVVDDTMIQKSRILTEGVDIIVAIPGPLYELANGHGNLDSRKVGNVTCHDNQLLRYLRLDVHNLLFIFQQIFCFLLLKKVSWKNKTCHDARPKKFLSQRQIFFSDDEETPTLTIGLSSSEQYEIDNSFPPTVRPSWLPLPVPLSARLDSTRISGAVGGDNDSELNNQSTTTSQQLKSVTNIQIALPEVVAPIKLKALLHVYFNEHPLLTIIPDCLSIELQLNTEMVSIPKLINLKPYLINCNETQLFELRNTLYLYQKTQLIYEKVVDDVVFEHDNAILIRSIYPLLAKKYDGIQLREQMERRMNSGINVKRKGRAQSTVERRRRKKKLLEQLQPQND
ncbi:unnamed protein product [Didymodactylos carnosus]|uniref:Uncharacterized protein n=1 Tax=Didymodactylos carnosus TaxID=1234261 RepID=A0A8S2KHM3_9BILA|nr:unnamed protein product [Didymodactylos carnosus]CAF3849987.1 unnamed protein product [Didymodactylos carnosus]